MQGSQKTAEIIKALAKSNKVSVSKLLVDCELNKNALYTMQSGGYYPRVEALIKIADYFDCSVDYLLGRTDTIKTMDLPSELIEAITSSFGKIGTFISLEDMVIAPRIGSKNYFIRSLENTYLKNPALKNLNDNDVFMEIYEIAKEYNPDIMEKDDYVALFDKYVSEKFGGYDASGYTLTPQEYEKFLDVYENYKKGVVLSAFEKYKNENSD